MQLEIMLNPSHQEINESNINLQYFLHLINLNLQTPVLLYVFHYFLKNVNLVCIFLLFLFHLKSQFPYELYYKILNHKINEDNFLVKIYQHHEAIHTFFLVYFFNV